MIKRKIIELEGIGFYQEDNGWKRVNAATALDKDGGENELEIHIDSVKIAIPVDDIIGCLEELGIDLEDYT